METFGTSSILALFNETTNTPRDQSVNISQTTTINPTFVTTVVTNTTWNCTTCPNITTEEPIIAEEEDVLLKVLKVLQHANYFLLPMFLLLGLAGNTLTIIIMTTGRYAHLTSRLILIALAVSDTVLLLTQPLNKIFVIEMTGVDLRALSDAGCKIYFVMFKTGKMTSSWFVVLLCFERFVAVWFPLRAKMICTQRNTILSIVMVYIFIGAYNSVWSRWSTIVDGKCHPDVYNSTDPAERIEFGRFLIAGCCLYSFIPSVLMFILTPLIIKKLLDHKKRRRSMTGNKNKEKEARITAMLLGIVIAYTILILPVTFLHLISFLQGVRAFGQNPNGFLIFRDVTQILEQVNYAINFFLYVTTSQQFRSGLMDLLCCRTFSISSSSSMSSSQKTKYSSQRKLYGSSYASYSSGNSETENGNKFSITTISNTEKEQKLPPAIPDISYP
ncbi:C-C chemokine receptor type 1-like [Mizuhopecten yessoensis]|uniref:Growth hormone secretagogue receptor type 1 n=1 Tax=Mizuhopecten yessoensis TaxID=6573 RepID=A0A210PW13_MIZYE|nr:C-C chemokine receptor type 1-like [Mizuhopecten yessoensis]OWF40664.1 Growth hormone secretagogue receptor type 1 [Mizuhopecten yessoensis]